MKMIIRKAKVELGT